MARGAQKKVTISIGFDTSDAKRDLKGLDKDVERSAKKAGGGVLGGFFGKGFSGALANISAGVGAASAAIRAGDSALFARGQERLEQLGRTGVRALTGGTNADDAEEVAREIIAGQEGQRRAAGLGSRDDGTLMLAIARLTQVIERQIEGQRTVEGLISFNELRRSGVDISLPDFERDRWQRQQRGASD